MASIITFEVGYCTHPGCMALKGASWKACQFPARAYLIEVNQRYWLWDTGYADYFHASTRTGLFWLYRAVTPVYFDPQQALIAQLKTLGITANDIQGLIISHFHGDHIAGLRDFSSLPFICSREAWLGTRSLRGIAALQRAFIPELIPDTFEQQIHYVEQFPQVALPAVLHPFTDGYALPGSEQQVVLVPLPGHAVGQIGAFIQTDTGWVLLASDAAWSVSNYRELRGPSRLAHMIMHSPADYYQTLDLLHQLDQKQNVDIRLTHEGEL